MHISPAQLVQKEVGDFECPPENKMVLNQIQIQVKFDHFTCHRYLFINNNMFMNPTRREYISFLVFIRTRFCF